MHQLFRLPQCAVFIAALLIGALLLSPTSRAHDIPGKVTLLMYVKPEGNRVLVLARAPLEAFSEIQYPQRGPGYLDVARADAALRDAANVYLTSSIRLFADGQTLGEAQLLSVRASLLSDKSFVEFATALAHVQGPGLPADVDIYWKQTSLDVLLAFPLPSGSGTQTKFSVAADWQRLAMETHTVLRYLPTGDAERAFDFIGNPGVFELEPGWWHAFSQFVNLGFFHILDGVDHLLFLICLVIPTRSVRALIPAITAFTLAHTVTLISSAMGLVPTALWFAPLIETLIALSVLYMACENLFGARLAHRWVIVFCFGLIHGFGFSFILADRMQFAGEHLVSSLLAFNVGVELGQLLVLIVAVPLLRLLFVAVKRVAHGEVIATILLSALAAHSAWHWLTERGERLLLFKFAWPTINAAFLAATMRWLMLLIASGALLWVLREAMDRIAARRKAPPKAESSP